MNQIRSRSHSFGFSLDPTRAVVWLVSWVSSTPASSLQHSGFEEAAYRLKDDRFVAYALLNAEPNGQRQKAGKGSGPMDIGVMLIVSNTLMAIFLYFVVKLIWQE